MKRLSCLFLVLCMLFTAIPAEASTIVWSDWTLNHPGTSMYETKKEYRNRFKISRMEYIKEIDEDGWTYYKSDQIWSEYGPWSNWGRTEYQSSTTIDAETRVVIDLEEYTEYTYYSWRKTDGKKYSYEQETSEYVYFETTSKVPFTAGKMYDSTQSYKAPATVNFDNEVWFLKSAKVVPAVVHQEWRYRERKLLDVHFFYKWSDWGAWSSSSVPVYPLGQTVIDTIQEFRIWYRYPISGYEDPTENNDTQNSNLKKGKTFTAGQLKYKITSVTGTTGKVEVCGVKTKTAKTYTIPASVTKYGCKFSIVGIGKKAFSSCKKMKSLKVKTKKLTYVHKKAFSGLKAKKYRVYIPESCKKKYKKLFK